MHPSEHLVLHKEPPQNYKKPTQKPPNRLSDKNQLEQNEAISASTTMFMGYFPAAGSVILPARKNFRTFGCSPPEKKNF